MIHWVWVSPVLESGDSPVVTTRAGGEVGRDRRGLTGGCTLRPKTVGQERSSLGDAHK